MKNRDLQIAEAVLNAVLEQVGDYYLDTYPASQVRAYVSVDLPAIIASVPAPEPVYQWRDKMTPLWEDCSKVMFDRLSALERYEMRSMHAAPTAAELDRQVLDAARRYINTLQSEGRAKSGHLCNPATRDYQQRLSEAYAEFAATLAAAENEAKR